CRRLVREDAAPLALAAVDATVVDTPTGAWFEHRLGDVDTEHVVLAGLDPVEPLREERERALGRCVDDDLGAHRRVLRLGGHGSSSGCSTSCLKLTSASVQNRSSCTRSSCNPSGLAW